MPVVYVSTTYIFFKRYLGTLSMDTRRLFKKNCLTTGIADLDIIMEGGYANPSSIALVGPAGLEKALLAFHFLAARQAGDTSYLITADSTPDDIMQKSSSAGVELPANTRFIDCYSSTLGKQEEEETKNLFVPGPSALNDLSLAINEAMKESDGKKMRVVFYSFSTFMLYNPKDSILKFLQVVGGRLKKAGATTIFIIEEGVHDSQLLNMVEHNMDAVYHISDKSKGLLELRLPGIQLPLPIKTGSSGITIL